MAARLLIELINMWKGRASGSIDRLLARLPAAQKSSRESIDLWASGQDLRRTTRSTSVRFTSIVAEIRRRHPEIYSALMALRRRQLAERHEKARVRARAGGLQPSAPVPDGHSSHWVLLVAGGFSPARRKALWRHFLPNKSWKYATMKRCERQSAIPAAKLWWLIPSIP
jgi:hypothetical protein